jgi:tRNA-modifying protein YgfZ
MNSFFVGLKEHDTVVVNGPDAAKFLQGQMTCDVNALADNTFSFGAACNNKGRVFASFIIARHGADFHILLDHGLAKVLITNLQKFMPFYKCSMKIDSGFAAIGLAGTEIGNTLKKLGLDLPPPATAYEVAGMWLYNLQADNSQFILLGPEDSTNSYISGINELLPAATLDDWAVKNMLSGHFPFTLQDVDKYTPQELHLDQSGYISFSKGCYTGQEIIARMHYRGKVKKRLYLLEIENVENIKDSHDVEIFDDSGKSLGSSIKKIVDRNSRLYAIASMPVDLASTGLFTKEGHAFAYRPFVDALQVL